MRDLMNRPRIPLWARMNLGAIVGLGCAFLVVLSAGDFLSGAALERFALTVGIGAPILGASTVYYWHRMRRAGRGRAVTWVQAGAGGALVAGALLYDLAMVPLWAVGVGILGGAATAGLSAWAVKAVGTQVREAAESAQSPEATSTELGDGEHRNGS